MANNFSYGSCFTDAVNKEFNYESWVNGGGVREVNTVTDLPTRPESTSTIFITRDLHEMWWFNPNTESWVKLGSGGSGGSVAWGQIFGNISSQADLVAALEARALAEAGVPQGGTTGQVLAKVDGTDYNTTWVTPSANVEIDNKTIVRDSNNKLKTAAGGYVESGTAEIFDGAFSGTAGNLSIAIDTWTPFADAAESYTCTLSGSYVGDGVQHSLSGNYTAVRVNPNGQYYEIGLVPGSLSLRMYGPSYETVSKRLTCEYNGSVVVSESQLSCTVAGSDIYHAIDGKFIPVDGTTIALNSNGQLTVVAPSGKEYIQEVTELPTSPTACVLYARTTDKTVWIYISGNWVCVNSGTKSVESVASVSALPTTGAADVLYIVKDIEILYTYYDGAWRRLDDNDGGFIIYNTKSEFPTYGQEGKLYYCREDDTFYYYVVEHSIGYWRKTAQYNVVQCQL